MDPINPGFTSYAAYDPNGLFASDHPVFTRDVTIISGQNLAAGALVGRITASDKYNLSLAAAGDGSNAIRGVLLAAVDASGGDKIGTVAFAGGFDEDKLVYGTGHTKATAWLTLAEKGIFLYSKQAL